MIFITGANGLLGGFICRKLLEAGYKIKALRRFNSELHLVEDIQHQIEWVEGDILDLAGIEKQLKNITTVIHCAALVSYDKKDQHALYKTNVEGTANIVNACINTGITKMVYISSIATIGKKRHHFLSDEDTTWSNTEPITEYARTKYLAELEVWRGAAEGLKPIIINPSVILGPGEWNKSSTKIFKYILDEKPFYTEGSLNFEDVRDVAEITIQLLNTNIHNERYIVNADSIAYKELFIKIAQAFRKRPPWIKVHPKLVKLSILLDKGISWLLRREPMLKNDLSEVVKNRQIYDNSKIRNFMDFNFRDIDDTINWSCDTLLKKIEI
jgi:nucleoside-diphosphate-sugar epimerase